MNKITTIAARNDGPRFIDPNTSLAKQAAVLDLLRKNPPENSRRVTVTPALAEHILITCNNANRPRRPQAVKRYAEDMAADLWRLTGEPVIFGRTGQLRDGQHRLAACVRAGVPFETYMLFGVDDDAFNVMNIGRKRDGGDTFAVAGIKNAQSAAAALRWLKIFTGDDPTDRSQTFSNRELLEHYNSLDSVRFDAAVADAKAACRGQRLVHEAPLGALVFLYRKKHQRAVDAFLADLTAGKRGGIRLSTRLDKLRKANLGRMHENQRNAMIVNTINAYVSGAAPTARDIDWNDSMPFPVLP